MNLSVGKIIKCIRNATKPVWKYELAEEGTNWDMWTGDKSAPHAPVSEIFTGPNGVWGTPNHVNGLPNHTGTHPDLNLNEIVLLGDRDLANEPSQQARLWGYKRIPADGFLRDINGNTGETGRIYCGIPDGCCNNVLTQIAEQATNTNGTVRGILGPDPVPVRQGDLIPYVVLMSDATAFFGFDLEFSENGEDGWTDVQSYVGKGQWVKEYIPLCDDIPEGYTDCPPEPCDTGPGLPNDVPSDWRCEEVPTVVGYVTVAQNGNVVQNYGDVVVTKLGTGLYNITAPAGAETSNAWAIIGEPGDNNNNDVRAHFSSSFTTGDFHIEQQSGNGQWQDVDKPFTIHWYGMRQQVVC